MPEKSNLSRNQKRESDLDKDEAGITRVGRVHGGELVELISKDDIQPDYNIGCRHQSAKLGDSTDFDEIECPDCPMVWVYEYGTVRVKIKA